MTGGSPPQGPTGSQAILTPITEAAIFLTLTVDPGAEDGVRDLLSDVSGLRRSVGFRIPEGALTCVVGIGAAVWERLFGQPRPAELHPFPGFAGARHSAPATPGDLLFHIRAHRFDLCFELAQRLTSRLGPYARVVDEVHGFRSFDERDLLGFVDGTENPEGAEALAAVVIADEDPAFAGGSYVVVQKYLHDLAAWDALPVEEQERAMGRTKLSDIELPDEVKPANSHVALNTIVDENGDERQIVRVNMPFGNVGASSSGPTSSATPGDADEHVHGQAARQPRPHPRLLHRGHRQHVLRPRRRVPRRPATPSRRPSARGRGCVRGRLTRDRKPERASRWIIRVASSGGRAR